MDCDALRADASGARRASRARSVGRSGAAAGGAARGAIRARKRCRSCGRCTVRRYEPQEWVDRGAARSARDDSPMLRLTELLEHDIEPRLGELDAPSTLIWGADDGVLPLVLCRGAAGRRFPNADLQIIEGAAHIPHMQQPERFLAMFDGDLLSGTRARHAGQARGRLRRDGRAADVRATRRARRARRRARCEPLPRARRSFRPARSTTPSTSSTSSSPPAGPA